MSKRALLRGALALIVLLTGWLAWQSRDSDPRVLVFSRTSGYRHASIGPARQSLMEMAPGWGMTIDTTENAAAFSDANLDRYDVVLFLSTTQDVLDERRPREWPSRYGTGTGL